MALFDQFLIPKNTSKSPTITAFGLRRLLGRHPASRAITLTAGSIVYQSNVREKVCEAGHQSFSDDRGGPAKSSFDL